MAVIAYDITRLILRKDAQFPTGIDRVDISYALWFLANFKSVIFVNQTTTSIDIVNQRNAIKLVKYLGKQWGCDQSISIENIKYKHLSYDNITSWLEETIENCIYVNVSHICVSHTILGSIATMANVHMVFFIHDLIPVTHPHFVRKGDCERISKQLKIIFSIASLILVNSRFTQKCVEDFCVENSLAVPNTKILEIGCEKVFASKSQAITPTKKYFVYVSTLEPRKNHRLLLAVWRRLYNKYGKDTPTLALVGKFGWNVENLNFELQTDPVAKSYIRLLHSISDSVLAHLIAGCESTLNPSYVEGWGMPAVESLAMGKLTICSDIDAYREATNNSATYLPPDDVTAWYSAVCKIIDSKYPHTLTTKFQVPSWNNHFDKLKKSLSTLKAKNQSKTFLSSYINTNKINNSSIQDILQKSNTSINNITISMSDGYYHGRNWWPSEAQGCWFGPETSGTLFFPGTYHGTYDILLYIPQQIVPNIIDCLEISYSETKLKKDIKYNGTLAKIHFYITINECTTGSIFYLYVNKTYTPAFMGINQEDMRKVAFMLEKAEIRKR